MHYADWILVLLLNGSVVALGVYLSRRTETSRQWFLGRRALPWWGIGLSIFATSIDNADLVSITGQSFREGLHPITVYAIGGAAGAWLAAFVIVPAIYRAGFYTNAEYLEARYGVSMRVLSALIQIQYRSCMLGLMIWAVYLVLTGLDIADPVTAWMIIVALVIAAGVYAAWGGLRSVVWTDAVQSVFILLGSFIVVAAVWNAAGGWDGMVAALERADAQDGTNLANLTHMSGYDGGNAQTSPYLVSLFGRAGNLGPWVVLAGWTIIGSGYWVVNHNQTMRLMGARSLWDMKMAATLGAALSLPLVIGCNLLGLFGHVLPEGQALDKADLLVPRLINAYVGIGLKGLVVAGVLAAAVSTFDSMGTALSAIFTRDVYARLLVRNRDDAHYVRASRWATVGVLIVGFTYIPFILLQKNMLNALTSIIPVFVTPLFAVYILGVLTRVNRRSGLVGLLVGSAYGVFALYCREAPRIDWLPDLVGVPLWLTDRWGALCLSLLITAGATLLCSVVLGFERVIDLDRVHDAGWLADSRHAIGPAVEHPFRERVPWWANPAIYLAAFLAAGLYVQFWLLW